jgi:hypothetical protein
MVLAAVQFDDEPQFDAREVGEVTGYGVLSSKMQLHEAATRQVAPLASLRVGLAAPHFRAKCRSSRDSRIGSACPSREPRPTPISIGFWTIRALTRLTPTSPAKRER